MFCLFHNTHQTSPTKKTDFVKSLSVDCQKSFCCSFTHRRFASFTHCNTHQTSPSTERLLFTHCNTHRNAHQTSPSTERLLFTHCNTHRNTHQTSPTTERLLFTHCNTHCNTHQTSPSTERLLTKSRCFVKRRALSLEFTKSRRALQRTLF